jgi:hypothetical protein
MSRSVSPWRFQGRVFLAGATLVLICALLFAGRSTSATADEPGEAAAPQESTKESLVPFNKTGTVLVDKVRKRVLLKTQVTLREGSLEQLCCLKQTKEHESILSLDAKAFVVHTALLAVGAKTGAPVRFDPEYKAPTGQKIEVYLSWADEQQKVHRVPAQQWIREMTHRFWSVKLDKLPEGVKLPKESELRYDNKLKELSWYGPMNASQRDGFLALSRDKAFRDAVNSFYEQSQSREMKADWVFAGSGFYTDEETGKKFYLAEDGDLLCVANFPGATIDVAVQSSSQGDGLLFEAYTERIPPKGTPVTIELIPILADEKANTAK